jgi:hypothetical protein
LRVGEFRAARIFPAIDKRFWCHHSPKSVTFRGDFDQPQFKTKEGIA